MLRALFVEATGRRACSCDSRSRRQKGTDENADGLIGQLLHKGAEFVEAADVEVRRMQKLTIGEPQEAL